MTIQHTDPSGNEVRGSRTTTELPAWPVLWLLWGLPLWWLFGLFPFSVVIVAMPMVVLLLLRRSTILTPGVLPWLAFVLWMLPCAVMLDDAGNMMSFIMRFGQLLAVGVVLLYVINARAALPPRRVLSALCAFWAAVIVGGYLGLLWPNMELTFTVGRLLPSSLMSNEYVQDLFFPPFADVQTPWGAEAPFNRPSAPFSYTNGWGAAIALLTPAAIAAALERKTKGALMWLTIGLLAIIPPAVQSTNRGLFLTLGLAIGYVVVRLLWRGHWGALVGVGALSVTFGGLLKSAGFLDEIAQRQETADTTEGRTDLYMETFARSLQSPVLGYGAPRPAFSSEIYVGTQGMVWNVMFCFGMVGLILFMAFLLSITFRTWAAPSTVALWLHASLIATCIMSIYYGLDRQLPMVAVIAGLMLRERFSPASRFWRTDASQHRAERHA